MNADYTTATPTVEELKSLRDGSALTMIGYLPEETLLYIDAIKAYKKNESVKVWKYTSDDLNNAFGTNLPVGLNIFSISLDELKDIDKLAVKERFQYGFRWLDDVVENAERVYSHGDE